MFYKSNKMSPTNTKKKHSKVPQKVDRRQRQIFLWLRARLRYHKCKKGEAELLECSKYIHKVLQSENENYTIFQGMLKRHVLNLLLRNEIVYDMCFNSTPDYEFDAYDDEECFVTSSRTGRFNQMGHLI